MICLRPSAISALFRFLPVRFFSAARLTGLVLSFGLFAFFFPSLASATATIAVATGGGSISADTTGGPYTTLTGPTLTETNNAGMSAGSMILTAPSGFVFDTTANSVTVNVTGTGTLAYVNRNNSTAGQARTITVTPALTTLTVWVTTASSGNGRSIFTWSGIRVRPQAGTPLALGDLTYSGTSTGVTVGTALGSLTEVSGAVTQLAFTSSPVSAAAGSASSSISVQRQDQFGNPNSVEANRTVTLASNSTGTVGFTPASLTLAPGSSSATFTYTDTKSGTPTLTASSTSPTVVTPASQQETLNPAPLHHIGISAISSPQTAGAAITGITLTAQDIYNNTVTAYTGNVTYGGTAGVSGTSPTFIAGQLTGVSLTPTRSGSGMTLTLTGPGVSGGTAFDVNPGTLDHFGISPINPSQTAGTPITGITLTAQDANNNTVLSYGSPVLYSGSAGITGTSSAFTAGVLTGISVTPTFAGPSQTFVVTGTGSGAGKTGTATFAVLHAPLLDHFTISPVSSPRTVGVPITGLTLTAEDVYGNTFDDFVGAVSFGGTAGITGNSGLFTAGVLTGVSVTPLTAGTSQTFTVEGLGRLGSIAFQVNVGALDHFAISPINSPQTAGTAITGVTLTAQDVGNNTVTSFTGTVDYGGTAGILGTSSPFIAGALTGVSVTPTVSGAAKTFTLSGGGKAGSTTFDVDPGVLDHFAIGTISNPQTAGIGFSLTVTAQDANNNTRISFQGTVSFSGTAGVSGTSAAFSHGQLVQNVTATTAGSGLNLMVTGPAVHPTATSNTFTVSPGSPDAAQSMLTPINSTISIGGTTTLTVQGRDGYGNPVTTGGAGVAITLSSGTGSVGSVSDQGNGTYTAIVTSPASVGSGTFVATLNGQPVKSGGLNQTQSVVNYTPVSVHHFDISGFSSPLTAGTPVSVTITAKDSSNNVQTSFSGSSAVVTYGGTAGIQGTSGGFSSGVLTTTLTPTLSGQNLTFTVAGAGGTGSSTFTVTAASATKLVFTSTPVSTLAGVASTGVTVQRQDQYGNPNSTDSNLAVSLSTTSTGVVVFNPGSPLTITQGTSTQSFTYSDTQAGSPTLTASSGLSQSAVQQETILVGPLHHWGISTILSPQVAGSSFPVTITAQDQYNNTRTTNNSVVTYQGTAGITGTGQIANGVLTTNVTPTRTGNGLTFEVEGGGVAGTSNGFSINAGALHHFAISGIASPETAGDPITGITLTAQDINNNTVTGFTGSVTFSGTAGISGTSGSFVGGILTGVTVTPTIAGANKTFIVSQNSISGTATFNVTHADSIDHFTVSSITSPQTVGVAVTGLTLKAYDAYNNLFTGFIGRVNYGGTAGVTGLSAPFVDGVLTGVSITPLTAGSGRTFEISLYGKTGSQVFDVNVGALHHIAMSPIASPQTAGTAINGITLTAQDIGNNTLTSFTNSVTYGGTAGITGSSAPFVAGVLAGVSVTPTIAGSNRTFTVTSGGVSGTATFDVYWSIIHHFTISSIASPQSAGVPITGITITAQDAYNNTVQSFTGQVTYSGTAGATGTSGSFVGGQLVGASVTPTVLGTGLNLVATYSGRFGTSNGFSVSSGIADARQSTLLPTSSSITANGISTQILTVQARDQFGNNLSVGGATVTMTQGNSTGTISAVTDHGDGTYTALVTAPTLVGSGAFVATLNGSPVQSATSTQTVATVAYTAGPADAAQSTLTPTAVSITANGTSTQVLTVQANDRFGNPLSTNGSLVTIRPLSGSGTIDAVVDNGNGSYSATVTSPITVGSGVFVATLNGDPVKSGNGTQTQATVYYTAGSAASLTLDDSTDESFKAGTLGRPFLLTVRDAYGNTAAVTRDTRFTLSSTGAGAFNPDCVYNPATLVYEHCVAKVPPVTEVSIPAGSSSASFTYSNSQVGRQTLTTFFSSGDPALSGQGASHQIEIIADHSLSLALQGPTSVSVGATSALWTLTVTDQYGNPSPLTQATSFSVETNHASSTAIFSPSTPILIPVGGSSASFTYSNTVVESNPHRVTASFLEGDTQLIGKSASQNVTVQPGAAAGLSLDDGPITSVAAGTLAGPFVVTVKDRYDNPTPVSAATVFNLQSTGIASFNPVCEGTEHCGPQNPPVMSGIIPQGQTSLSFTYSNTALGIQTVTTTGLSGGDPGLNGLSVSHPLTIVADHPLLVSLAGPQSTGAGVASGPFTLTLTDQFGNPSVVSQDTSFRLSTDTASGSAVFLPSAVATIPRGQSSATFTYRNTQVGLGLHLISARFVSGDARLVGALGSTGIILTPGPSAQITLDDGPETAVQAGTYAGPFILTVRDSFGNPAPVSATTSFGLASTGTGLFNPACDGNVHCVAQNPPVVRVTIPNGQSSLSFSYANLAVGTQRVTTSTQPGGDPGLSGTTASHDLLIIADHPLYLIMSGPTSVALNVPSAPFTLTVTDQYGNASSVSQASQFSLTTDQAPATAVFAPPSPVTMPVGASSVTFTYRNTLLATNPHHITAQFAAGDVRLTGTATMHAINLMPPNGQCGSASGQATLLPPARGALCQVGIATSPVAIAGGWAWSCNVPTPAQNASCSAPGAAGGGGVGRSVTLTQLAGGCTVNSASVSPAPGGGPTDVVMSYGVVSFQSSGCSNVNTTWMTTYSGILDGQAFWKYIRGSWVPFEGAILNGRTATFVIVDNGPYDADPAIGSIADPSGPGLTTTLPAPTQVSATAGDQMAVVSFREVPGATRYEATCLSPNGGTSGLGSASASPVTVRGLTNGAQYTCRVIATNGSTVSPESDPSNVVVPHAPIPPAPIPVWSSGQRLMLCFALLLLVFYERNANCRGRSPGK